MFGHCPLPLSHGSQTLGISYLLRVTEVPFYADESVFPQHLRMWAGGQWANQVIRGLECPSSAPSGLGERGWRLISHQRPMIQSIVPML